MHFHNLHQATLRFDPTGEYVGNYPLSIRVTAQDYEKVENRLATNNSK